MVTRYFTYVFDAAHFFELLFLALSWSLLENRPWRDLAELGRACRDLAILFTAHLACDILLTSLLTSGYLFAWLLAQGVISAFYVFCHREEFSRAGFALWCSMYAGMISLAAMGGQASLILAGYGAPGAWQGLSRVILNALGVPLALYLNAKRLNRYDNIPPSGLIMILAGDACLFLLRWLESHFFTVYSYSAIHLAAAYFCVLVLVLCAVYAVDSICREQARSLDLLSERQRAQSERDLVALTQKQLDDLHQLRHDIKNQYSYMHILLSQRRYDELDEYFSHQAEELTLLAPPLDCGNRAVSIIMNMERQKAAAAKVALTTKLVVPPVLPFPDSDLCSILANLIDNAIDECVRLGGYFPRIMEQGVTVAINPSGDYLVIEVRNPTDRKTLSRRADGLLSTKSDPTLHGYGTRIVTRLAEKYNGSAMFDTADEVFTARVMLDMMKRTEEVPV